MRSRARARARGSRVHARPRFWLAPNPGAAPAFWPGIAAAMWDATFLQLLLLLLLQAAGSTTMELQLQGACPSSSCGPERCNATFADASCWWEPHAPDGNATAAIAAALATRAPTIFIPAMDRPWVVAPMPGLSYASAVCTGGHPTVICLDQNSSGITIVFAPGVLILAKSGAFHGLGDTLLRKLHSGRSFVDEQKIVFIYYFIISFIISIHISCTAFNSSSREPNRFQLTMICG